LIIGDKNAMLNLKKFLLDLIFPVYCLGCNKYGAWLCPECSAKIDIKAIPMAMPPDSALTKIMIAASYRDELVSKSVQFFKYRFIAELGENLGEILIKYLKQINNSDFDLVIPVPLHRKRQLWRGFNQSAILAQVVCREFGWPLALTVLKRWQYTQPQVGLGLNERLGNVSEAFRVTRSIDVIKGKKILIIDDVFTTGATMQACAKALKSEGASEITGLVIAKG
jgi:ComF family protein